MSARLYVGDLPFSATDEGIRALFESVGVAITSISITRDRMTGQSRGFGFVDVADQALAQQAIDALHGRSFEGRNLIVNVAQERAPQVISAGGGGYGSGGKHGTRPRRWHQYGPRRRRQHQHSPRGPQGRPREQGQAIIRYPSKARYLRLRKESAAPAAKKRSSPAPPGSPWGQPRSRRTGSQPPHQRW